MKIAVGGKGPVFLILAFITVFLCAGPDKPAFAGANPEVAAIVVDGEGRWSPELQKYIPPGASFDKKKKGDGYKIILLEGCLSANIENMGREEKSRLLKYPVALLSSKKASGIFSTPRVLIVELKPEQNTWRASGFLFAPGNPQGRHTGSAVAKDPGEAMKIVLKSLPHSLLLMDETLDLPVVSVEGSKLFHRAKAGHITEKRAGKELKNPAVAIKEGLLPCPACFYTGSSGEPADPVEAALSLQLTNYIENTYALSADSKLSEAVERTGRKIVEENRLHRYSYRFRVLDTQEVNAFSVPAGGIYISRGLMDLLETEDELAGVLSHEIAHCEKNHSVRTYYQSRARAGVNAAIAIATGSGWIAGLADFAGNFFTAGWSREFEAEADLNGMIYSEAAGYDAGEYITALKKLRDYGELEGGSIGWFRTHPTDEQRINQGNKILKDLRVIFEIADKTKDSDPALAHYLKTHPLLFINEPGDLRRFIELLSGISQEGNPGSGFRLTPLSPAQNSSTDPKGELEPPRSLKPGVKP